MLVFCALTRWSKILQKRSRMFFRRDPCFESAFEKVTKSSTKNRWDNVGPVQESVMGLRSLELSTTLMLCPNHSIHNTNKYGDSGQPWSTPLAG